MGYKPMLAGNGTEDLLKQDGYIFEPKMDGIRAIIRKEDSKIKIISRNGIDITEKYDEFDFIGNINAKTCVLDGEIVVYDDKGNPSFHLWQQKNKGEDFDANYVVFDILEKDGKDLTLLPLIKRKEILKNMIKENERLQLTIFTKDGKKLWDIIKKRNLEGIIAKKADSLYEPGKRTDDWLKIKIHKTADAVILGYTVEKRALSSLALGTYQNKKLVFSGKVGTGFDEDTINELREKLEKIRIKKSSIENLPEDVYPVKPIYKAEIKFQNITKDNKFRAPVFLRLSQSL